MARSALDEGQISLNYYARQQCSRQWVHFLAAMFAEFEDRVEEAEAGQFLTAIGFKMALLLPLRRCDSLGELEEDINNVLEGIDWGWARLREDGSSISITHGAYPVVPQDESRRSWLVPILEGLYAGWLGDQGGEPAFTARLTAVPQAVGAPLSFSYGRHE